MSIPFWFGDPASIFGIPDPSVEFKRGVWAGQERSVGVVSGQSRDDMPRYSDQAIR